MWSDQEKKIHKIDHLARSLLIQGLQNDIYSLIDSNETAKDLWDALERQMRSSVSADCELNFKFLNNLQLEWKQYATMMRQNKNLLDINIDALYNILKQNQGDVNDAMKSKKKAVVITSDPLALKFYSKPTNNNLRASSATSSANKKQEYVKFDDKKEEKKVDEKKRDMRKVKCYNCKKEGNFAKDCKKAKVKDYEYYKTKMLLAKKDKDEQVLLVEDQAWMESSSDSDQEINANMVFMAQIVKALSDLEASSSCSDDKITEVSYYTSEYENEYEYEYETSDYYDNSTTYGLFVDNNDDQEIFHDSSEIFSENLIESQIDHNESDVTHNDSEDIAKLINQMITEFDKKIAKYQKRLEKANQQSKDFENPIKFLKERCDVLKNQTNSFKIADQEILFEKMSRQLVEMNNNVLRLQEKILEKEMNISELEGCVSNKDLEIEKCFERLNDSENKLHKIRQTNQTIHMIMPSKDSLYNGRKGIGFKNPSYFKKAKDLRPSLYDETLVWVYSGVSHSFG
nr:hypothetical protein [Tanacetum cinerariifolium]